jgi:hypothetical protein
MEEDEELLKNGEMIGYGRETDCVRGVADL